MTTPYLAATTNSTASAKARHFINGEDLDSPRVDNDQRIPNAAAPAYVGLGPEVNENPNGALTGEMAEMIVFEGEINQARRTVVQTYLANKYGLPTDNTEVKSYAYTDTHFGAF
ncbi:MAG: hypothetical protein ACQETP_10445, partial [Bacteroidota bacterium]